MEIQKDTKLVKILRVGLIVLVVFWAIEYTAIAYSEKTAIYNTLNALKLIPEPERFTELYFDNASKLPKETVQGLSDSFSFTVSNLEGATTTYPYRVYFGYPSGAQVTFATGLISLADNASTTISVSHTFLASNEQGMVVVLLPSLNQSIDFLLPDNN